MPRPPFALFPLARIPLWMRAIALSVSAVLLLANCQSGGDASGTGSTTASPTSSATVPETPSSGTSGTPAATASASAGVYKPADAHGKAQNVPVPVMPELAKENSKEGLEAFIRYWYAQLSYVDETGDMSGWRPLYSDECRLCLALEESGEDGYVDGRWLAGGRITVPAVDVQWTEGSVAQPAKVQIIQEPIDYYNSDGTVGRPRSEASNDAFALFAKHTQSGWTVVDLGVIA